jgi:hypothetical protein
MAYCEIKAAQKLPQTPEIAPKRLFSQVMTSAGTNPSTKQAQDNEVSCSDGSTQLFSSSLLCYFQPRIFSIHINSFYPLALIFSSA